MYNIVLALGMCFRLINSDPWQSSTYKIEELGSYSVLTEVAMQHVFGWRFQDSKIFSLKELNRGHEFQVVECPNIYWRK